jgi:hypothetical protein
MIAATDSGEPRRRPVSPMRSLRRQAIKPKLAEANKARSTPPATVEGRKVTAKKGFGTQ